MDTDMFLGVYALIVFTVLASFGSSAITIVWFPRMAGSLRILTAVLAVPIVSIGPIFLWVLLLDGGASASPVSTADDAAATIFVGAIMAAVGWPFAFLISRALDRQRAVGLEIFE